VILGALGHSARRGSYRVLYEIDDGSQVVTVIRIAHRSGAYRTH
jgi:mRNA-degrading endonuclease RelE of RelBE toxin-antitoxin system